MEKLPKYLYKYESINDYSLMNLEKSQFYFRSPLGFNDPYDSAIFTMSIDARPCKSPNYTKHLAKINKIPEADIIKDGFSEYGDEMKKEVQQLYIEETGCTCFSEEKNHILMWSHYANGHAGFCLEFNTDCFSNDTTFKVIYEDTFPIVPIDDMLKFNEQKNNSDDYLKPALTKAKVWKYEKEWRAFSREPNKLISYDIRSLTGIYFGTKIDEMKRNKICEFLLKKNKDIRFYQMRMVKDKFKLEADEFPYLSSINKEDLSLV